VVGFWGLVLLAGWVNPGYRLTRDYISALASRGADQAWLGVAALLYAASDEWHQSFVPGRTATPRDVAIDAVGICLATLAATRTRLRAAIA